MLESLITGIRNESAVMAMMVTLVLVMVIGTSAQILAERIRIPATAPLLIAGLIFGPDLIGLIQPSVLEEGASLIIKMAVAVIIFEGGMLLNVYELRHASRAVTGLITVGLLITTILAGLLARYFMGMSWEISLLFGAIVSVTGPTVITPILQRVNVNRRVRSTLESESIIADPLGVILAAILFTAIMNPGEWTFVASHAIQTMMAGAITGTGVALCIWLISARLHLLPVKFSRIIMLGAALLAYAVAETIAHESGVLAAAIAGIAIGSLDIPHKHEIEDFKGDLVSIAISAVFILLAASLKTADLIALGWSGIAVVVLLMVAVRPIRVFLSTYGSELKTNEKLFISFLGPRGIVAASVATFFSIELIEKGYDENGKMLVSMVFAVILGTVLVEGTFAGWFAKIFKVMPKHTVIIGADETGRTLAEKLIAAGESVSMIDNNEENYAAAQKLKGLSIYLDDATSADALKTADVGNAKTVIVATPSDKVNILVSQIIRSNYPNKRIVARANTTSNISAFQDAGIEAMSPVQASVAILENMVRRPSLFRLLATVDPEEEKMDEIQVSSKQSAGRTLAKLHLEGCLVVAIRRDGKLISPNGNTVLRLNDILTILGNKNSLEKAKTTLQVVD